jgi:hypothetical protein
VLFMFGLSRLKPLSTNCLVRDTPRTSLFCGDRATPMENDVSDVIREAPIGDELINRRILVHKMKWGDLLYGLVVAINA